MSDPTEAERVRAWFSVRHVLAAGPPDQRGVLNYEERVTIWEAEGFEAAYELARAEAEWNAAEMLHEGTALDLFQVYQLDEEEGGEGDLETFPIDDKTFSAVHGAEVFSMIRSSDLTPGEYLDRFFDTGCEFESIRVRIYRAGSAGVRDPGDTPGAYDG